MKRLTVVDAETYEILTTVTTRYNSINTLFDNFSRWNRRHPEYKSVDFDPKHMVAMVEAR